MPTSKSMQRLKEEDPERYREIVREQKRRYRERHPGKIREQKKKNRQSRSDRGLPANNTSSESYKKRRKINVTKRAQKVKESFKKFKKLQKCRCCGESDPICIDFHHVDGYENDDIISKIMKCKSITYSKLVRELNKCVPLCSNCHRKVHGGILPNDFEAISITLDDFKML